MPRRRRGLKGTDYATVYRPVGDRDRHGDLPEMSTHTIGPCLIAWATAWASVKEVVTWPVEATDHDVSLYFTDSEPDVDPKDYVELGNKTRYRVVAVEPYTWGARGTRAGTVVRLSGLNQGE